MNILVVAGYCLRVNSSANLCHLSYINGLLDCGHQVDLLTVSERNQNVDTSIALPRVRNVYTYGASLYEQLGGRKRRATAGAAAAHPTQQEPSGSASPSLMSRIKTKIRSLYGPHSMDIAWYYKAKQFRSRERYDLVISLSDPPASHKLTGWLLRKGRLKAHRWVQIWEDPWYADIYGLAHTPEVKREEASLLEQAQKVLYVSPLTLLYQKQVFPEYAHKMDWMPLPSYYQAELKELSFEQLSFGYFGDYTSHVRNLRPFYEAAVELGLDTAICGNSDTPFPSTDTIRVYPRMSLGELKVHEDRANTLIFLCNLRGGQIPGKIYQYAATNKVILFIMDGTPEEKSALRDYFEVFDRFVFCENDKASIADAIRKLQDQPIRASLHTPLARFEPKQIITEIVEGAMES